MSFNYKFNKYLIKFNELSSYVDQINGGVISSYNKKSGRFTHLFNKDTLEPEIKVWSTISSSFLNFNNEANSVNVSNAGIDTKVKIDNLYELINNINIESINNDNLYFICLRYINYPTQDFQIGITETRNYDEDNLQCANRGSIEEIGIQCLDGLNQLSVFDNITYFSLNANVYDVRRFSKKTKLGLRGIDHINSYELNGGMIGSDKTEKPINPELSSEAPGISIVEASSSVKPKSVIPVVPVDKVVVAPIGPTQKSLILIYGDLENLTRILSARYSGDLTFAHYTNAHYTNRLNKPMITKENLDKANKERKEIQILAVAKSEILKILKILETLRIHSS